MNDDEIRRAQGERLRTARVAAGYRSARDAALQNEWAESSYRAHESGTRTIGQDDAERYAARFRSKGAKISAEGILFGSAGSATSRSELTPAKGTAFTYARVLGTLEAGLFRDVEMVADDVVEEVISAPVNHRYPWARQGAWRVVGDSLNQAKPKPINEGDFVIGVFYEDIQDQVPLKDGLKCIVRRTRDNGQSYEWTLKELKLFPDRAEFRPNSNNPKNKPIIVKRDFTADDGTRVEVFALLQYVFDNHEMEF